jgi:fibronectin type 3 domain-containing protein
MQTTIPTLGPISWGRRLMPATIALGLLLLFGFAQTGFAQADPPLNFGNNFFVTGDYVVAGAHGMDSTFTTIAGNSYAVGTITIPDTNKGIQGVTQVPAGAQIVAAVLYWQAVEKVGQPGTGQNGFFRPVILDNNGKNIGPSAPGFQLIGLNLPSSTTVSFSSGGCSGTSTGKVVQTYRADVRGYLPQDASGNITPNVTYTVMLPSTGSTTPITLGATLVIIYRVLSPSVPLNAIVIYDGAAAPTSASPTMTQTIQGFYDAATDPSLPVHQGTALLAKLTHIAGHGQSNKFEAVNLNGVPLKSLYAPQPPFPGSYVNWDNPTWTFANPKGQLNLQERAASVATTIVASMTQPTGCVSSAAIIFSTIVNNSDNDGILDVWKDKHGYCDASWMEGQCNVGDDSWVDLSGAAPGQRDIFVQFDYMCSNKTGVDNCGTSGVNYSFDPHLSGADIALANAFANAPQPPPPNNKPFSVHFNNGWKGFPKHAIQEVTCSDATNGALCAFPGQPGAVAWKAGFIFLKNQLVHQSDWTVCDPLNLTPDCVPRFQHGRKDSYHYVLFGDKLGGPNWSFVGKTLISVVPSGNKSTTVTFTTSRPHHLVNNSVSGNGRVTIADAITNPNLNGTHLVTVPPPAALLKITKTSMAVSGVVVASTGKTQGVATYTFTLSSGTPPQRGDFVTVQNTMNGNGVFNVVDGTIASVSNSTSTFTVNGFAPSTIIGPPEPAATAEIDRPPFTFSIDIGTPISAATPYTPTTDPSLSIFSGQTGDISGYSDVGGSDSLITLGAWGASVTPLVTVNTWMHELGHSIALTHGGLYYDTDGSYVPTVEANCKANFQSVMSYRFQFDLPVPDYSRQELTTLDEKNLPSTTTLSALDRSVIKFPTQWYALIPQGSKESAASKHCDGTPKSPNDVDAPMYLWSGSTSLLPWGLNSYLDLQGNLDINYDGTSETVSGVGVAPPTFGLRGYNEWVGTPAKPGIDPRQIGAYGSMSVAKGGGLNGGGNGFSSGGGGLNGGGGGLNGGGGGLNGGGGGLNGGGGGLNGGGGGLNGGGAGLNGGGAGLNGGGGGLNGGGSNEITLATANSVTRPPRNLTATEDVSPRNIHLFWNPPTFGQIGAYNIYRQPPFAGGNPVNLQIGDVRLIFHNDPNDPHFGQYEFVDTTATCNPAGYTYFVSALLGAGSTNPGQESPASNTVSTGQNGQPLTGCYSNSGPATQGSLTTFTTLSFPNQNFLQGDTISITWLLQDDDTGLFVNANTAPLTYKKANTLSVFGPFPNNQGCPAALPVGAQPVSLLSNGVVTAPGTSGFNISGNQFTFMWDTSPTINGQPDGQPVFSAGCYFFTLKVDSVTQSQTTTSPLQLQIDVTDADTTLHVTTVAIPNGVVGTSYSNTISEDGGVTGGPHPFAWCVVSGSTCVTSGSPLPTGVSLGLAPDGRFGLLSGIPSAAGMFRFTVQVTDSAGNIGTQTLTMTVTTPVAQINQPLVPDRSVPGAAAFVLTLNGTGFGPGSVVQWNGTPLVTTFISNKQLTAVITAPDVAVLGTASVSVSNPVTVSNQPVPNSNVNFVQITPATSASLSRTDTATGNSPSGLIAADFNGDGKLDLAIANSLDNTVSILLGNGDGTFAPASPFAVGSDPFSLVAGDFNNDGKLDLAVVNFANSTGNNVSILLGNGDGTFQPGVTYTVGTGPISVITGDFNRDGKLDLAVANRITNTVSILLGNGDGTFQPHVDYVASTQDVAGLAVGDFNGDGKLDLAVTNPSTGQVSILLGNGDGTFQTPVAYSTGAAGDHPTAVTVADFNGDGILDLAVTKFNTNNVAIFVGNGDGTFKPEVSYGTTAGVLHGPGGITIGDFNGDGLVDLAITNQDDSTVSILLGNGNGTFQSPLEFATANHTAGVAAGDFNGDGRLDVAVANVGSNTVSIMLQRPEPPSTLVVSNATASQVGLTWTASASTTVVGYNVYRGTTSGGPYTKVNSVIVAAPAFTDMSVNPGTTYYYVVTAVDPGNLESVKSNEVSATTPPLPPTALAVTNVTASQVTLTWTDSTTASVVSYNVYRSTTPGVYTTPLASVNAAASTYTDMSVAEGTTYYYVVTGVGPGNAESVKSNEVFATTPPQPPTGLTATAGSPGAVTLAWTASTTNNVSYNVYRSTTQGAYTSANKIASAVSATGYPDSGLASGTTYYYVVTAMDTSGNESAFSNEAFAVAP